MATQAPRFAGTLLETTLAAIPLHEDPEILHVELSDENLIEEKYPRLRIQNSLFKNCSFTDSEFIQADWTDCRFENCDFSNVTLTKGSFNRVEFVNCRMTGIDFSESRLYDVRFDTGAMPYGLFSNTTLKNSVLESIKLDFAHFYKVAFDDVTIVNCSMEDVTFEETKLKDIDLSSNSFEIIKVELEDLRGATVSTHQALLFASLMGLRIKD